MTYEITANSIFVPGKALATGLESESDAQRRFVEMVEDGWKQLREYVIENPELAPAFDYLGRCALNMATLGGDAYKGMMSEMFMDWIREVA